MQDKTKERWLEVCEQIAVEQNHDRLLELIRELNQLLEEKKTRIKQKQAVSKS